MNRIKYRVWDNYKKTFVKDYVGIRPDGSVVVYNIWYDDSDSANYCDESWTDIDDKNQYEIQQFTGLKDKNEKEIYEGDIIKAIPFHFDYKLNKFIDGREIIGHVWYPPHASEWIASENHLYSESSKPLNNLYNYIVIGNIYENPKLLK